MTADWITPHIIQEELDNGAPDPHRWWHLRRSYYTDGNELVLVCAVCWTELRRDRDTGYRCEVCGSAYCYPEAHH